MFKFQSNYTLPAWQGSNPKRSLFLHLSRAPLPGDPMRFLRTEALSFSRPGVSAMGPGATALQRRPNSPHSRARFPRCAWRWPRARPESGRVGELGALHGVFWSSVKRMSGDVRFLAPKWGVEEAFRARFASRRPVEKGLHGTCVDGKRLVRSAGRNRQSSH